MSLRKPQKKSYHCLSSVTLLLSLPPTQTYVVINSSLDKIWMNNNKLVVLAAFIVVCGEQWKAEAGHRYVQHAISACYGTLFACAYLLHMVWFHGYN